VRGGRVDTMPDLRRRGRGFESRPWAVAAVHQRQLSVPSLRGRLVSTSETSGVNGHTTRRSAWPVSVVLRLRLVPGWGLKKRRSAPPHGPFEALEMTLFLLYYRHVTDGKPIVLLTEGLRIRVYQVRKKYNFSNLVSKCSAKCALFSARVYRVMFCTYYSPEGEMCYRPNATDHAWVAIGADSTMYTLVTILACCKLGRSLPCL